VDAVTIDQIATAVAKKVHGQKLGTSDVTIGVALQRTERGIATLLADSDEIDEASLAAHLAPLLAVRVGTLSDADLAAVAQAVNDESAKRQQA
jgi:hypothetical protein